MGTCRTAVAKQQKYGTIKGRDSQAAGLALYTEKRETTL